MAAQMECTKSHCFTWSDWIRKKYVAVSRLSSKPELERLKIAFSIGKINRQSSRPELTSWGWEKARKRRFESIDASKPRNKEYLLTSWAFLAQFDMFYRHSTHVMNGKQLLNAVWTSVTSLSRSHGYYRVACCNVKFSPFSSQ